MDLKEFSKELAEALVEQLSVIDERQGEQRSRWFTLESGVNVEVVETYRVAGKELELPRIGIERPSRLDVKNIKATMNSDLSLESKNGFQRLITRVFAGSATTSEIKVEVELERSDPSEGMMALHKNAANRIKHQLQGLDFTQQSED